MPFTFSPARLWIDYLHRNPVTDLTVAEPEHYVFSPAANYAGAGGLLNVLLLE